MTHSTVAEAPWAIEVDRGDDTPPEYYSIVAMRLAGPDLIVATSDGEQVRFANESIRKILIMRTVAQEAEASA